VVDAISVEREEGEVVVVCLELGVMRKRNDGLNEVGVGSMYYVDGCRQLCVGIRHLYTYLQ
jgi:hypothetical protein